jgi:pilus assembly protein CpaB
VPLVSLRNSTFLDALRGWPRRAAVVCCLLLAALSALHPGNPHPAATPGNTRLVLIAARPLAPGALLSAADVNLVDWPERLVPSSALSLEASAIGHRVGASVDRGEPLTRSRLLDTSISAALAPGQVAVSVSLRDQGQSAILAPGSVIDLYAGVAADAVLADGKALPNEAAGREIATAVTVLALVSEPSTTQSAGLVVVLAVSRSTASRLANLPSDTLLATLRAPP